MIVNKGTVMFAGWTAEDANAYIEQHGFTDDIIIKQKGVDSGMYKVVARERFLWRDKEKPILIRD